VGALPKNVQFSIFNWSIDWRSGRLDQIDQFDPINKSTNAPINPQIEN
jgi:hypothetical protein